MSILSVEIMRPGKFGLNTSAVLEMPATRAEYHDAKQKARITDDKVIYSYELLRCEHDKFEWYAYKPTPRDMEQISEAIDKYLEMFQEPVQNQGMSQQMR